MNNSKWSDWDSIPENGFAMKFNWSWCDLCECAMVICPQCGNNSCNGTYGCDLCKKCYDFVENAYENGEYPHSEAEIDKFNQRN